MRRGLHGDKAVINTYLWLAIGAIMGAIVAKLFNKGTKIELIESVGVAIFGAFIGGEFIAAQLGGPAGKPPFALALGLGLVGAAVMLVALAVFRPMIGPLKAGKSRMKDRG